MAARGTSIFLAAIGIFVMLLNSCKEKDCHKTGECPPEYYKIRLGEVKDYLFAKPGSYWIYRNSNTGELDTQTCIEFLYDSVTVSGTQNYSRHITILYDRIFRTTYSSFNKAYFYEKTNSRTPDSKTFNSGATTFQRTISSSGYSHYPFLYPFKIGAAFGDGVGLTQLQHLDTTFLINNKPFNLVARFDLDIDQISEKECPNYFSTSFYWAKDVGLIKKEIKQCNYSWELIEYSVIR